MKLENQVVSLDIAKRLKELGVKQESLFVHTNFMSMNGYRVIIDIYSDKSKRDEQEGVDFFSAFTVAELGEMLPFFVKENYEEQFFEYGILSADKKTGKNRAYYARMERAGMAGLMTATTEADARGKMVVYLLENKLITLCEK